MVRAVSNDLVTPTDFANLEEVSAIELGLDLASDPALLGGPLFFVPAFAFPERAEERYLVALEGAREPLACSDVRGFREAARAALDPAAALPARLVLAGAQRAPAWLERWAEDEERVHRTVTVRSVEEGVEITVIATLSSYGSGVDTQLAIASIRGSAGLAAPASAAAAATLFRRSGVHPKVEVEAALARFDAEREPSFFDDAFERG